MSNDAVKIVRGLEYMIKEEKRRNRGAMSDSIINSIERLKKSLNRQSENVKIRRADKVHKEDILINGDASMILQFSIASAYGFKEEDFVGDNKEDDEAIESLLADRRLDYEADTVNQETKKETEKETAERSKEIIEILQEEIERVCEEDAEEENEELVETDKEILLNEIGDMDIDIEADKILNELIRKYIISGDIDELWASYYNPAAELSSIDRGVVIKVPVNSRYKYLFENIGDIGVDYEMLIKSIDTNKGRINTKRLYGINSRGIKRELKEYSKVATSDNGDYISDMNMPIIQRVENRIASEDDTKVKAETTINIILPVYYKRVEMISVLIAMDKFVGEFCDIEKEIEIEEIKVNKLSYDIRNISNYIYNKNRSLGLIEKRIGYKVERTAISTWRDIEDYIVDYYKRVWRIKR